MTIEEKIVGFKELTRKELEKIARDPFSSELDFLTASVELAHRDRVEGSVYTPEEVLENVLGKNNMAFREV